MLTVDDVLCNGGLLSTVIDNYKQRDGQIEIAKAISDSYDSRKTVLVNAPTGNGKSIACLVPAILNKSHGKTIISTATKALQSQYEYKDIPMLHTILDFKSCVLKGRDNYICLEKFYRLGHSIPRDVLDSLELWLKETTTGDLETFGEVLPQRLKSKISSSSDDCLESDCPYAKNCFYSKMKAMAINSDILIINHDLLALYLSLKEKYEISMFGEVYSIIVDEAHKLEEIMTKHLGFNLNINSTKPFISAISSYCDRCLEKHLLNNGQVDSILSSCDQISSNMYTLFRSLSEDEDVVFRLYPKDVDMNLCEATLHLINKVTTSLPDISNFNRNIDKKVVKTYEGISKKRTRLISIFEMLKNIETNFYDYCYYADSCDDVFRITLTISPIDVSDTLSDMLFSRSDDTICSDMDIECVTLMSATLSVNNNFDFIKKRLGICDTYLDSTESCISELSIPEMFDYKHSCLLYVPKGIIEPSNSGGDKVVFTNQIIDTVLTLDAVVDGGILSLFTSYSEMDKVYNGVHGKTDRTLISQTSYSRQKALDTFKENENAIFFGTKTFWEGIDIQGRACSCVLIDRIPFPVPSEPIIEARIDKIKRENGDWFSDFYLCLAITALQQGFGRLIRTHKDLGMIVLMDNRIINKPYGRKILRSLPKCLKTRNIDKVNIFWDIVRKKRELRNGALLHE